MDTHDIIQLIDIAGSPIAIFILAFFVYKVSSEVRTLRSEIHDNGFVRKDVADERDKNLHDRIESLENRMQ